MTDDQNPEPERGKRNPRRKLRGPSFSRPYITNGVLMDVDPEKAHIFQKLREFIHVAVPDIDIMSVTDWRTDDQKYFFDHPIETTRVRPTTEDERLLAEETAVRLGGMDLEAMEKKFGPYFKFVLVGNVSPGFRVRVSIDKEDRDPKQVSIFNGWLGPGLPAYLPLEAYVSHIYYMWSEALQLCEEDAK